MVAVECAWPSDEAATRGDYWPCGLPCEIGQSHFDSCGSSETVSDGNLLMGKMRNEAWETMGNPQEPHGKLSARFSF
uniref:Glucan endo-1,3-beta-D-glucosidase n=1 Tax=Setaria digitata TaxID=48799 RepID=A0A915PNQ1_9BILA